MLNKTIKIRNMLTAAVVLIVAAAILLTADTAKATPVNMFNGWAEIGDTGNANDTGGTGHGGVGHTYSIAKYEVSDDDYDAVMNNSSGIDEPKNNISLYGAMEFANALTEDEHGSSDYNVYSLETGGSNTDSDGYSGYSINYSRSSAISDGNLVYAIPTEDEWYKAAYGDANKDGNFDDYSVYANGETNLDNKPPEGGDGTTGEGWNYNKTKNIGVQDVGFSPEEQNGTYDMMGNIYEWQEDENGVLRGGNDNTSADTLSSSERKTDRGPTREDDRIGFRVIAVPEPGSAVLFLLAGGLLWFMSRRRVRT